MNDICKLEKKKWLIAGSEICIPTVHTTVCRCQVKLFQKVVFCVADTEEEMIRAGAEKSSADGVDRQKKLNEAIEKLNKYEMRALNLFRDVDLVHIQQIIDANNS